MGPRMLQSLDADGTQAVDTLPTAVVVIPMVTLFNSTVVISTLAMVATMRAVVLLFMAFFCVVGRGARGLRCQVRRKGPKHLDEQRRRDCYV
jgi:hypothetical protein